jgi:hypothetical protein
MPSVRGVINLEACGTSGPELLFQATSVPFVEAYSKVPYPFGTVLANDIFATGLILSDTDFRQFVQYGQLSGLDIAVIGNSYLYHTRLDVTSALEPGMMQHFGENIIAIVDHLVTSPESKLAVNSPFPQKAPPIYFSIAGRYFFLLSHAGFRTAVMAMCALSNFLITTFGKADRHFGALRHMLVALVFTIASLVSALVSANIVAVIMTQIFQKPLSWYTYEELPVLLFGPPAFTGILITQYAFSRLTKPHQRAFLERASLDGLILFNILGLIGLSMAGIGSAYLFALGLVALVFSVIVNDIFLIGLGKIEAKEIAGNRRVHPLTYLSLSALPAVVGSEGESFSLQSLTMASLSPSHHRHGLLFGPLCASDGPDW